jgi:spermidine synthase
LFFVPTYPTGMWSFQYGLKGAADPRKVSNTDAIKSFVAEKGLRYYNEDIHFSTFALPNFVKQLIQQ